ncbi:hypothetical protein C8R44DRAFT_888035 [Mycena epipterygia]|nr:hypothetical protein C8R44DRAFT_888035 [Mycena epipterygia]
MSRMVWNSPPSSHCSLWLAPLSPSTSLLSESTHRTPTHIGLLLVSHPADPRFSIIAPAARAFLTCALTLIFAATLQVSKIKYQALKPTGRVQQVKIKIAQAIVSAADTSSLEADLATEYILPPSFHARLLPTPSHLLFLPTHPSIPPPHSRRCPPSFVRPIPPVRTRNLHSVFISPSIHDPCSLCSTSDSRYTRIRAADCASHVK